VVDLLVNEMSRVVGVKVQDKDGFGEITSNAVILGSGGFSSNAEMRCRYLGPIWDTIKLRGTRYNTGECLRMALELGAQPTGQWSGSHCSIVGAEQPPVEFGDSGNRYSYPFSIMVDQSGVRFVDEGEDFVLLTYAKYGKTVLNRPQSIAYQMFDAKVKNLIMPFYEAAEPIVANTIEELADGLEVDPTRLRQTIEEYNKSVSEKVEFDPAQRDGKSTVGVNPRKSNWALKIDTPPYVAYAVTGGLTFTFGGLRFNKNAQVIDTEGHAIPGLYATGEVAGFFYYNYPGGSGLTRGTVFGRIAGARAAAEHP
jgi:tricarballylate dehydrogenase